MNALPQPMYSGSGHASLPPLAICDVDESPQRRASMNAAFTQCDQSQRNAAIVNLSCDCIARLGEKEPTIESDFDRLHPTRIAAKLLSKVQQIEEIANLRSAPLPERDTTLRDLASGRPSRPRRDLERIALSLAADEADHILNTFRDVIGNSPRHADRISEEGQELLAAIQLPEPDLSTIHRLSYAVSAIKKHSENPLSLPQPLHNPLKARLEQDAEQLGQQALDQLLLRVATDAVTSQIDKVRSFLEDCQQFGRKLDRNLRSVERVLHDRKELLLEHQASILSGACVALESQDTATIVAGVIARRDVADRRELLDELLSDLRDQLSIVAANQLSHLADPSLADCLCYLSPDVIADTFVEVIEETIGDIETVYRLTARDGIESIVRKLYQKAEPLIDFGSRDHAKLLVDPGRETIVFLPGRRGADVAIYERLKEAFSAIDPQCIFRDAPHGQAEITCIRTVVAWPIAIDSTNAQLLPFYAESGEHRPHLFGILSKDGKPLQEYIELHSRYFT